MFGFKYQRISLISTPFENGIFTIDVEFIFILKVEVILIVEYPTNPNPVFKFIFYINNILKTVSFTFINDTIYTIITNII